MLFCIALLNEESVHALDSNGDGLDDLSFYFEPDSGIRLSCAAVPRVGWAEDGSVVLYHGSHLTSGGGQFRSVSSDGLSFSASEETPEEVGTPIDPDELPPMLKDRDGFPGVVVLPSTSDRMWCNGGTHRIFTHNAGISGTFGTGVTSLCSTDGKWFWDERDDRVTSPNLGYMGVMSGIAMNNRIHLFTMDGHTDDTGITRHRVWHYRSTDGTGDVFELLSDDPLNNGETSDSSVRHNDPQALILSNGDALLVTMQQHMGPIQPDSHRTGIIHGWRVSGADPTLVSPEFPDGSGGNTPLITSDAMVEAGHDVYSLNDPSVLDLELDIYRLYMGVLVDISSYPEEPELNDCVAMELDDGTQMAWVILSATSSPNAFDSDNDGVIDVDDAFPNDADESVDTDSDGTGNNADTDDDNDGVNDESDTFPLDKLESVDTDSDGTGNNADTDDDNDGVNDASDAFPLDATESADSDDDGYGDNLELEYGTDPTDAADWPGREKSSWWRFEEYRRINSIEGE